MQPLPLPIASYVLPAPSASCSRLLNCFPETAPPRSMKGDAILRRSPGIRDWIDRTAGPSDTGRGAVQHRDELYVLIGTAFQKISANGTATSIGTVPGSERVRIVSNGEDMVVWRPFNNTLYGSDGASIAQLTDPMLDDGAADPVFLDGYIVVRRPGTADFFNTGLNALTWNGLDIASAEGKPGNLVGLQVNNRELILQKADSSELWYNAANLVGSPFSRSPSGFLDSGSVSSEGCESQDNSPFWLANDKTVRRLQTATPERVSQHGIEAVLDSIQLSDAYALPHFMHGHLLIAWVFPFAARTIVYDCTTGQWHERDSLGYGAWRASHIVECYGEQIVLDRISGKIGYLRDSTFDEFGEPQRVRWTYQAVYANGDRAVHDHLRLILNVGNGLPSGQGSNPLATLRISDDGGNVFRTHVMRELGRLGQYKKWVDWFKLGTSNNRVYSIDVTDPVQLFTFATNLEARGARL